MQAFPLGQVSLSILQAATDVEPKILSHRKEKLYFFNNPEYGMACVHQDTSEPFGNRLEHLLWT